MQAATSDGTATATAFVVTASGSALGQLGNGVGSLRHTRAKGFVANGANAGNLQLQWAQNTANPSDTTVRANSALKAWQLGAFTRWYRSRTTTEGPLP